MTDSSTPREPFFRYCFEVFSEVKEEIGWGRDNLLLPAVGVFAIALFLFILFHVFDEKTFIATALVYGLAILLFLATCLIRAPWKLANKRLLEIEELRHFKKSVEEKRVRLKLDRLRALLVIHKAPDPSNPYMSDWAAIALRAVFTNPLKHLPGKTAEKVLAKITYIDQNERTFSQFGRWAGSTQPELLHPLESKNPLLPMDFLPGAEHELDIATKPPHTEECWAVSNDSFPKVLTDSQKLVGQVIRVLIELTAANVQENFELFFHNLGRDRGFGQVVDSKTVEINSH